MDIHDPSQNSIVQETKRSTYYKIKDIKSMRMGDKLMICPYDAMWYFQAPDASILPMIANTDEIRRYLPGLNMETEDLCKKTLEGHMMRVELGLGFTHVIRLQNIPIGMIFLNSPKYNEKVMNLRIWTVDFFIAKQYEHMGIMYNALLRVLHQLKGMEVKRVYATVDQTNTSCINLLGNGLFDEIDNSHFKSRNPREAKPRVFMIDLTTIRFER